MKKKLYIAILIIFLYFLIPTVFASNKKAMLTGNQVNLRSGPGTNYNAIASLSLGSVYNFADETLYSNEKGSCTNGWYKILYESTAGYVCFDYISIITESTNTDNPNTECEKTMKEAGFPSSYWSGLCALKERNPNWNFTAINTNLDWNIVVEKESQCGNSYIATSNQEYIDNSCTNYYTKTWYPASQKAVAYYMDPRNWFDEKYIFQFEYLKYDKNLQNAYPSGVQALLKNAAFYQYHLAINNNLSNIINEAGSNTEVSPIFLSSRMLQELGTSSSEYDLYSGVYTGHGNNYYGYYNFFNYGVSDSCATTNGIAYCGLDIAKRYGWNSPLNSIKGTSGLLSSSYIAVGQYTTYLQKFNVVPTNLSKLFSHQYMTNIAAPSSESRTAYNSYNNLGVLNLPFTFYIPIYINMDSTINNSNSGGSGENPDDEKNISISSIVTSSGYKYNNDYISGIDLGTDVSTIINNLEAISGKVTIKNKNGEDITSGKVGTGFKVIINNKNETKELQVVIKGDTSGDGEINALDLLQVQKQILKTYTLTGASEKAGDTSGDGEINALDLLQVQKQILGTYNIEK